MSILNKHYISTTNKDCSFISKATDSLYSFLVNVIGEVGVGGSMPVFKLAVTESQSISYFFPIVFELGNSDTLRVLPHS